MGNTLESSHIARNAERTDKKKYSVNWLIYPAHGKAAVILGLLWALFQLIYASKCKQAKLLPPCRHCGETMGEMSKEQENGVAAWGV